MIDISIIIVNYNVKEYIIDCIQSIKRWTPEKTSYEIIVIDNKSEDDSVGTLTSKFPEITIIKNNPDVIIIESPMPAKYLLASKALLNKDFIGPNIVLKA